MLSDEIQHVRYANGWLRRVAAEDRRSLLQVASAVNFLKRVNNALAPGEGETNAAGVAFDDFKHVGSLTNVEDRKEAGFTDQELAEIVRQEQELSSG